MAEIPAAEYTTTARLPVASIWEFVREMDNWAPYVTGYQSHEKESETSSVWVLKGDVGVMARTLRFRVHITEWNAPSRVAFTLEGLNEEMSGRGSFELAPYEERDAPAPSAAERGVLLRLLQAAVRAWLRVFGGRERRRAAPAGPGAGMAKLTFALEITPGGPMAPMVNAMMKPALLPAAESLADRIMARLEEIHGAPH